MIAALFTVLCVKLLVSQVGQTLSSKLPGSHLHPDSDRGHALRSWLRSQKPHRGVQPVWPGMDLFGRPLYAESAGDLLLPWLFGIAFQYFTIKPMRNLSLVEGLKAALKSDTLAIITFLRLGCLLGWR
jgi:Domain of unknown function (DUF4396)